MPEKNLGMHLQTVDDKHAGLYKVWLEKKGRRICEAAGEIPTKVFKSVQTAIVRNRMHMEDRWVRFAIRQQWIKAHLVAPGGPQVIVRVYPNTPNAFTRTIDLTQDLLPQEIKALRPEDITLSADMGSLQIWPWRPEDERHDIRLSREIWQG
jgi:hypothetical protein